MTFLLTCSSGQHGIFSVLDNEFMVIRFLSWSVVTVYSYLLPVQSSASTSDLLNKNTRVLSLDVYIEGTMVNVAGLKDGIVVDVPRSPEDLPGRNLLISHLSTTLHWSSLRIRAFVCLSQLSHCIPFHPVLYPVSLFPFSHCLHLYTAL